MGESPREFEPRRYHLLFLQHTLYFTLQKSCCKLSDSYNNRHDITYAADVVRASWPFPHPDLISKRESRGKKK